MGANHYSRSSKLTGRHICIALTTLVAIAFAITVFLHSGPKVPNISSMWKQNQQGVQRTPRAFQARPEFNDLTASADDLWASIIPKNGGFVLKQKGKSWDVAGVSMFHQLHCLAMIREGIQVLQHENQLLKRSPHGGSHDHDSSPPMNDTIHWAHCLDYLMQGILCAADDTLEPYILHEGKAAINGYGVTHMCRDPMQIWNLEPKEERMPPWFHD